MQNKIENYLVKYHKILKELVEKNFMLYFKEDNFKLKLDFEVIIKRVYNEKLFYQIDINITNTK